MDEEKVAGSVLRNCEYLEPLQLLHEDESGALTLHVDQLEQIMQKDELRGRRLVVISVVGAFRKGKSFLLNVMLNYLRAQGAEGWIESSLNSGFPWRSGSTRETSGILVWPQVFLMQNNLAVLLMDTQGMFDDVSSLTEDSTIFSFATLLSSIQIFNVSQQIQMDDMMHLQVFVELGRLFIQEASSAKPFQHLMFLVRDWPHRQDYSLGLEGGNKMLKSKWTQCAKNSPEKQKMCDTLHECFDRLSCFLLCYPGERVAEGESIQNINNDAKEEFVTLLKDFVNQIFKEDDMPVKRVCGVEMTVESFPQFLRQVFTSFQQKDVPKPTVLMESMSQFVNDQVLKRALAEYEDCMIKNDDDVDVLHQNALDSAMSIFDNSLKLGGRSTVQHYREQLVKSLNQRFEVISKERLRFEIELLYNEYDINMKTKTSVLQLQEDLPLVHEHEVQNIISKLQVLRGFTQNDLQIEEEKIKQYMEHRLEILRNIQKQFELERKLIESSMTEEGIWRKSAVQALQSEFAVMGDRHYDIITLPDEHQLLPIKIGFAFFGQPYTANGIGYDEKTMNAINLLCETVKSQAMKESNNQIFFSTIRIHSIDLEFKNNKIEPIIKIGINGDPMRSIFIDCYQRVYTNWEDYIGSNKLPQCWLCAPENGVFQVDVNNQVQVIFEQSNACSITSRAATAGKNVAKAAQLGCAIAPLISPPTSFLTVAAVTTVTSSMYTVITGAATIIDRKKHSQSIQVTNRECFITYIDFISGAFAIKSGCKYLRKIDKPVTIWNKMLSYFKSSPNSKLTIEEFLDTAKRLSPRVATLMIDIAEAFKAMEQGFISKESVMQIRSSLLYYFHIYVDENTPMGEMGQQMADILVNANTISMLPRPIIGALQLTTCQSTKEVINALSARGCLL